MVTYVSTCTVKHKYMYKGTCTEEHVQRNMYRETCTEEHGQQKMGTVTETSSEPGGISCQRGRQMYSKRLRGRGVIQRSHTEGERVIQRNHFEGGRGVIQKNHFEGGHTEESF